MWIVLTNYDIYSFIRYMNVIEMDNRVNVKGNSLKEHWGCGAQALNP